MPRRPREDEPGAWHHVMNRGIAKGPIFASEDQARFFLAKLAREVRDGELEVLAYSLMTTHFHALVISKNGGLGPAFQRIESPYVKAFNRQFERDGGLMRGRYASRRVRSDTYRETLISYIDRNPAEAGIVPHGGVYPFGSAYHYVHSRGPIWLSRTWVEERVRSSSPSGRFEPEAYLRKFSRGVNPARLRWIEEQIRTGADDSPLVDRFLKNVPGRVLRFLQARARLADGGDRPTMVVDPTSLEEALTATMCTEGAMPIDTGRGTRDGWRILRVGLLRDLCGLVFAEIALRTGLTTSSTYRDYGCHQAHIVRTPTYAAFTERVSEAALRVCHGTT